MADSQSFDGLVRDLALSPDGRSAAVSMERPNDASNFARLWVTTMRGGPLQLVTTENMAASAPVWSADSRSLLYITNEGTSIYRRRADGSGTAVELATVTRGIVDVTLHPSGRSAVIMGGDDGRRRRELVDVALDGTGTATPLLDPLTGSAEPTISPDGRWLAYVSSSTGREEVYVRPYPDVDASLTQVSVEGGGAPRWSRAGNELFYVSDAGAVVAVRYSATDGFRVSGTEQLFRPQGVRSGLNRIMYEPSPDGKRFLMLDIGDGATGADGRPTVIQNFTSVLRARVKR
jgi:serine/threonine-protein kinase